MQNVLTGFVHIPRLAWEQVPGASYLLNPLCSLVWPRLMQRETGVVRTSPAADDVRYARWGAG